MIIRSIWKELIDAASSRASVIIDDALAFSTGTCDTKLKVFYDVPAHCSMLILLSLLLLNSHTCLLWLYSPYMWRTKILYEENAGEGFKVYRLTYLSVNLSLNQLDITEWRQDFILSCRRRKWRKTVEESIWGGREQRQSTTSTTTATSTSTSTTTAMTKTTTSPMSTTTTTTTSTTT